MDILDELEKLNIGIEFEINKESFKKAIVEQRQSLEEVDNMNEIALETKTTSPMEIKKVNTIEENESFMDLLLIYGNVIKNAETADKDQKKIHLENYILGMSFQFGLMINEFSAYLTSKVKEDLPEDIKKKHPDLTDDEFNEIKGNILDLLKIALPLAIQLIVVDNVGTPKLEIVTNELIQANRDKKFTRFMLSFLQCDMGNGNVKNFLMNYIKEENSKDIMKLILMKLSFYYSMWYFGNDPHIDDILLDLITEVQIKLSGSNNLTMQLRKGEYKMRLKQKYETQRKKLIG